jgi:cob(I)alamin adenosyltransferase
VTRIGPPPGLWLRATSPEGARAGRGASRHGRNLRRMRKRDEPVRLTRIYTRGGDAGETSLGDGSRVPKTDPRIEAIGDVDELNSFVGWAIAAQPNETLERVQQELFDLGADLSVPFSPDDGRLRVTQASVDRLEAGCDEANATLAPLRSFVLPGGSEAAARLFVARAVCRRAERRVRAVPDTNPLAAVYLNRLADLLFILARVAGGGAERLWSPGAG